MVLDCLVASAPIDKNSLDSYLLALKQQGNLKPLKKWSLVNVESKKIKNLRELF